MERDPQPYESGEESYLAYVMKSAGPRPPVQPQSAAQGGDSQGEQGDARRN